MSSYIKKNTTRKNVTRPSDIDDYINQLDKYDTIERSIFLAEQAEYIREENIKYKNASPHVVNTNNVIDSYAVIKEK